MIGHNTLLRALLSLGLGLLTGAGLAEEVGTASFYGRSHVGKTTASGRPFDMHAMTAAHRTLPLGSRVLVTNLSNGRGVIVEIADRGPYKNGRILDLSYGAAERLDFIRRGTARIRLERF